MRRVGKSIKLQKYVSLQRVRGPQEGTLDVYYWVARRYDPVTRKRPNIWFGWGVECDALRCARLAIQTASQNSRGYRLTSSAFRDLVRSRPVWVYFVQSGERGPIKIGYSTCLLARLRTLQVGNPEKVSLLSLLPAGEEREAELHVEFVPYRLRGEWYSPVPHLVAAAFAPPAIDCRQLSQTSSANRN